VGLVVELDGVSHVGKRDRDRLRDEDIEALGLAVFRVWNTAIYEDLECVLDGIWRKCQELRRLKKEQAPPNPSPPDSGGEGQG
jgi:very-short-patch-repair endonuclease